MPTPLEDLQRSGLSEASIRAMRVTSLTPEQMQERGWMPVTGYIIPYFDFDGKVTRFYRIRLTEPFTNNDGEEVRYLQPKGSVTQAYIPPQVEKSRWFNPTEPLFFTEGEKKSAKGAEEGLCIMGFGGVDSWRSRSIRLNPERVQQDGEDWVVRIPRDTDIDAIQDQVVAELLELPLDGRETFIIYDSGCRRNHNVQRAAFELSVWLQGEGANVRQILLPDGPNGEDRGLDDYLLTHSKEELLRLPQVMPEHPRIRTWLKKALDSKRLKRSDQVKCAIAILNALDTRGQRYVDPQNGSFYYFDGSTDVLHSFRWESAEIRQIRLSSFGSFLQQEFGIGATDANIMGRVADLYASGNRIRSVVPKRVCWTREDALYYQLSDSFVAKVSADGIEAVSNGTDGMLFLSGQVEPLKLPATFLCEEGFEVSKWPAILEEVNIQPLDGMSLEETQTFVAALFYLSPWWRRWRGLMLPVELVISEPNSGKTFLYNLRKAILTGRPTLSNSPVTQKDWYAQLASSGGLWVCDNMGEPIRELKETLSDELARLVTDPEPKIEMRKLYTTIDNGSWSVDSTFAITAIRNPFWKPDILQRSIVIRLKAIPAGKRDSGWYQRQIEGNGRAAWVADHLHTSRRFLASCQAGWNPHYLSNHRLVHFEQCLLHMGAAMGKSELMKGVVDKLFRTIQDQVASHDPILEALKAFVQEQGGRVKYVSASDICRWVTFDKDNRFQHLRMFQNPVSLGKYIGTHEYDIRETVGLYAVKRHNQNVYEIVPVQPRGAQLNGKSGDH